MNPNQGTKPMKETEYNGNQLGASVKEGWKLTTIKTGHVENATAKAMQFDFGYSRPWVPNSLIAKLIWKDQEVSAIEVPTWFAIKEDL